MNRKMTIFSLILFFISLLIIILSLHRSEVVEKPVGIVGNLESMVVDYDPNISSTYNIPYAQLKNELLYAKLTETTKDGTELVGVKIEAKERLIEIIREFDKLKSTVPKEYNPYKYEPDSFRLYTLTIWREDKSVTYVFVQSGSTYYEGSTALRSKNGSLVLREMPERLVELVIGTSELRPKS